MSSYTKRILLALLFGLLFGAASGVHAQQTYRVRGRLFYFDGRTMGNKPLGAYNPAHNVKFEVYDRDSRTPDDLLAGGILGPDGRFDAQFPFLQAEESYADIYVRFVLSNSQWEVVLSPGSPWDAKTGTQWNRGSGTVNFGDIYLDRSSMIESAMWVFQSLNEAHQFVEVQSGHEIGNRVTAIWPSDQCGSVSCAGDMIYITASAASNGRTHLHELGHVINSRAWGGFAPFDYCLTEPRGVPCSHSWNSREYPYPALIEGWADFVAYAVLGLTGTDLAVDLENRTFNWNGYWNEGNVAAVLNDIFDANSDFQSAKGFNGADTMSWGFSQMAWVLGRMSGFSYYTSIADYVDEFRELYGGSLYTWRRVMQNSWCPY